MNSKGEIIIYETDDGKLQLDVLMEDETLWLTQSDMANLFQCSKDNISLHLKNIYEEGELEPQATTEDFSVVRQEGDRQVKRTVTHYNLDVIISVGYRVKSMIATRFRIWATKQLKEYIVKGFVMNDERLKNPGGWDYFDELLERIREIRASEKRFYQKIRDLFALSVDYKDSKQAIQTFFAEVQNKLLYAVTGYTAAELIVKRSDSNMPNMNLTSWEGSRVRKSDVITAKNYLTSDEIDSLNRLVVIFLEQAELRVKDRKQLTLDYWRSNVDRMLEFNEKPVLQGAGSISKEQMKRIAHERFDDFDKKRKIAEALEEDAKDLQELETLQKGLEQGKKK